MTRGRPRTKPAEIRREEILDAAQRLFLAQGVAATTIEQIAAAAGLSKGAFYLHFASKDEARAGLGDRFGRDHLAAVDAAVASAGEADWPGRLAAWVRASLGFYLEAAPLHDMLFREARSPTREGLVDNPVIDHLQALLEAGARAGAWSVAQPRLAALFLFSGLHAVADDAVLRPERRRETLVAWAQAFCFQAVGGERD